jgi:hypothetical protein
MRGIGKSEFDMLNKLSVLVVLYLLPLTVLGQYNSKGDLKSRFRPGVMWYYTGIRPGETEKVRKYDRLIFDVTYNSWNGDLKPFSNEAISLGLNTNLMFDIPLAKGNKVALGIGFAHEFRNVRHDNLFKSDSTSTFTFYELKDSLSTYSKSFLGGNSFSIPIELRFRNEGWKHVKFHLGARIGFQANLFNRSVNKVDGIKQIDKQIGFPDVNRLTYGIHARLGIRNWALFANYSLNPIFSKAESVQLNFLQFGLSLSLY